MAVATPTRGARGVAPADGGHRVIGRGNVGVRTLVETERVLRRVELRHPPFPVRLRVEHSRPPAWPPLDLIVDAMPPDRDSGEPRHVRHARRIPLNLTDDEFIGFVYFSLREVYTHELDEAFHVDGKRSRDPHEGEAVTR